MSACCVLGRSRLCSLSGYRLAQVPFDPPGLSRRRLPATPCNRNSAGQHGVLALVQSGAKGSGQRPSGWSCTDSAVRRLSSRFGFSSACLRDAPCDSGPPCTDVWALGDATRVEFADRCLCLPALSDRMASAFACMPTGVGGETRPPGVTSWRTSIVFLERPRN